MRVVRLLAVVGAMLALLVGASVASAHTHTITKSSAPGQMWVDPISNTAGLSVLAVPNIGCTAVDGDGFCTGGAWPSLPGARWIWKTAQTLASQNTSPYGPVIFVRRIDVPHRATNIQASIQVTADNSYTAYVNAVGDATGTLIGSGNDWNVISTFPVTLHAGQNWLVFNVSNGIGPADPFQNPAALLYKLRVTYTR